MNRMTWKWTADPAVHVEFQPLVSTWEAKSSPAGSMPGYSVVRVEVEGMRGLPVYIWKNDWEGMMRRTGSKPEYGECTVEFSPLGPGTYMVEPEGLGIWADVEVTGLEVIWLDFRRKAVPSSPNIVTELPTLDRDEPDSAAPTARSMTTFESSPPRATVQDAPPRATVQDAPRAGVAADPQPHSEALRPPRKGVCLLLLTMPDSVSELRRLLHYATQAQAEIIEDAHAAPAFEHIVVVGDAQNERVRVALDYLRSQGLSPITDLERLPPPAAD